MGDLQKAVSPVSFSLLYSHTSVLVGFRTHQILYSHFDERKNVSALGTCSGLIALARACMSHSSTPQEKMLHHSSLEKFRSVLVGFSTSQVLERITMSTRVSLALVTVKGHYDFHTVVYRSDN